MLSLLWVWRKHSILYLIVVAILCMGFSFFFNSSRKPFIPPAFYEAGSYLNLTGKITRNPSIKNNYVSFDFRSDQGHKLTVRSTIPSSLEEDKLRDLTMGSNIAFQARIMDPQSRLSHGGKLEKYLLNHRYHGSVYIEDLSTMHISPVLPLHLKLLQHIASVIRSQIDTLSEHEPLRHLLKGMLLGDYPRDSETYTYFQEMGLAHFLAVSGYHFYFLFGILMVILFLFGVSSPHREWIILTILFIYLAISGFQASSIRAFLMSSMLLFALIYRGKYHAASAWCISALLLLLWNPWLLFQAGFQLSFLGSLLIMEFSRQPWGLWLLPLPLMALSSTHFNLIQPFSVLFVAIFSPFLAIFFIGAWLSIILAGIPLNPLGWFLEQVYNYFYWLMSFFQSAGWTYRFIAFPYLSQLSLAYSLTIVAWILYGLFSEQNKRKVYKNITLGMCMLPLLLVFIPSYHPKNLEVTFLDIGQGDAIFIQLPEKKNILIDAGPGPNKKSTWDPSRKKLLPFLRSKGINKIDYVILSHFHDDHYGGLKTVFEHIPHIEYFLYPAYTSAEALEFERLYNSFTKTAKYSQPICVDQPLQLNTQSRLVIYGPPCNSNYLSQVGENDRSIILKLSHGNISLLFTGDLENAGEQDLLARYGQALSSQILKMPHHGSKSSGSDNFLDTVHPIYAVISCGKNNRFGHPHSFILDQLESRAITYFITHETGNLLLESNGEEMYWHFSIEH